MLYIHTNVDAGCTWPFVNIIHLSLFWHFIRILTSNHLKLFFIPLLRRFIRYNCFVVREKSTFTRRHVSTLYSNMDTAQNGYAYCKESITVCRIAVEHYDLWLLYQGGAKDAIASIRFMPHINL